MDLARRLTLLTLHYPHLELDEAVGEEAVILSLAAVAHRVPTHIQLARRLVLANFGVFQCRVSQKMDEAPDKNMKPAFRAVHSSSD